MTGLHQRVWAVSCALGLLAASCDDAAQRSVSDPMANTPPLGGTDTPPAPSADPAPRAGEPAPPLASTPDASVADAAPPAPSDAATTAADAEATAAPASGASSEAIAALRAHLAMPRGERAPIESQLFASVPLGRADAATARQLLWDDYADGVRTTRRAEHEAQRLTIGDFTLRYETVRLGDAPHSLFISMHGGGATTAAQNDSQWRNQVALAQSYAPRDALWIAPRAPTDDWNMWFKDHIDGLFDRLITNAIVFDEIDPDRVYVMGYSAGGDGVYQLGPRMADRWAGAAMSAGHPNSASPLNLRNLAFAIHVGGNDSAFDRNRVAVQWGMMLDALQSADAGGYPHQVQVHAGLGHWMELEDAVGMPYVQDFTRDPLPERVVWRQSEVTQSRFYWLAVAPEQERMGSEVVVARAGQQVAIERASGLSSLLVRLNDDMLDLDASVTVSVGGQTRFEGMLDRTILTLARTIEERGDPELVFSAELVVEALD